MFTQNFYISHKLCKTNMPKKLSIFLQRILKMTSPKFIETTPRNCRLETSDAIFLHQLLIFYTICVGVESDTPRSTLGTSIMTDQKQKRTYESSI